MTMDARQPQRLSSARTTTFGGKFANGAVTGAFAYLATSVAEDAVEGGAAQGPGVRGTGTPGSTATRTLTPGEESIGQSEFGSTWDPSKVRVTYDLLGDSAYTPNNTIHFPSAVSSCLDFSTCANGAYVGWFTHEATHTWQFQNGVSPFLGHIFSSDIFSTGPYLSLQQYKLTPNPGGLNTEKEADWHQWHYLCNHGMTC